MVTYFTNVLRKKASAFVAMPKHKNMKKIAKKLEFRKKLNWKMAPVAIRTSVVRATNSYKISRKFLYVPFYFTPPHLFPSPSPQKIIKKIKRGY